MKFLLTLLIFCAPVIPARAELPPALKPHAEKFESDRAALAMIGEARLKPVRDRYLAALATAQKAATAAAKTGETVAVTAEIESVNDNTLTQVSPPDLPRALVPDRRNYVTVASDLAKTLPAKLRELGTNYLRTLAAFEVSASRNKDAALTEAVAEEKSRVLALLEVAGGGRKFLNVVTNGDFSQGEAGGLPPGWKFESIHLPVTDAMLVAEGAEKFLRFRRLQAVRRTNLLPDKEINIPAKSKSAAISVRLRVKGLVPGKDYALYPGVHITAVEAGGGDVGDQWAVAKQDTGWKRFTGRLTLPSTAKTLRLVVGPFGAAGLLDVDDIEVEFK